MSQPTTSIGFSPTTPAAPDGYVNTVPQTDGGTPLQKVSEYVAKVGGAAVKTANYPAVAADNGTLLVFNSSSAVTLTLPATPPMAIWKIAVQNIGAGVLTIARNGRLIDTAAANLTLNQGSGVEIFTDGTNYFTERGGAGTSVPAVWVEEVPSGTMNGVNKVFTLSNTPTAGSLTLVNCIPQVEGTDFTIAANTITYTVAPKASDTGWHQARYQH